MPLPGILGALSVGARLVRGAAGLIGRGGGSKIVKQGSAAASRVFGAAKRAGQTIAGVAARNPRAVKIVKAGSAAAATVGAFEAGARVIRGGTPPFAGGGGGDSSGAEYYEPDESGHGYGGGGMDMTVGGGVMPIVTYAHEVTVLRAPRGYVLVKDPATGQQVAMLAKVAYALGLRKRRTRGGISGHEVRAAKKVQRFVMGMTVARQPRTKLRAGRKR